MAMYQTHAAPPAYPQPQFNGHYQSNYPAEKTTMRQFPVSFSIYGSGSFKPTYTLGEHENSPIYAVSRHAGLTNKADVILHSGPNTSYPPLATADRKSFHNDSTITLPATAGSPAQTSEILECNGGLVVRPTHRFTTLIETTGQRETFEWRHSHGSDVGSLGGRSYGWKLVRLSQQVQAGGSSDGKEVVAAWTTTRSISKKATFAFQNSGASGTLGERWALMTVITALKIWDHEVRRRRAAAASAGGAAGAGA